MRNLKVLGMTVVAIGALCAVFAASASAEYVVGSKTGAGLGGAQVSQNVLVTDVGNVKCAIAFFDGTQATEKAETLTLNATFTTCTLATQKVTINMSKCDLLLTKPSTTKTPGINTAATDIKCPAGATIVIKDTAGLGCEVKIGEQDTKGRVTFANELNGHALAEWELTGIVYSWTAGCPNAGGKAGNNTNGTLSGNVRLGANVGGVEVNFSVE